MSGRNKSQPQIASRRTPEWDEIGHSTLVETILRNHPTCNMLCYVDSPIQTKNMPCIHRQVSCKSMKQVATGLRMSRLYDKTSWLSTTRVKRGSYFSPNTLLRGIGRYADIWKEETTTRAVVQVVAEEAVGGGGDKSGGSTGDSKQLLEDLWTKISSVNGNIMTSKGFVAHQGNRPRLVENKRKIMGKIPLPTDIAFRYVSSDRQQKKRIFTLL